MTFERLKLTYMLFEVGEERDGLRAWKGVAASFIFWSDLAIRVEGLRAHCNRFSYPVVLVKCC